MEGPLESWLAAGGPYGAPCERVVDTSISRVFLYRDHALKLKKPVDFGFVNFTTLEKRRWAAEREVAFNRLTAPDIYLGARAVTRDSAGRFALDGDGETVEWAVEMRRFDENAVLAENPTLVDGDFAERLGRTIARHHLAAERGVAGGGAAGLGYVVTSNAEQLRALVEIAPEVDLADLLIGTADALARSARLLDERREAGFTRCCHGDMHLGNILVEHGEPVLFDCIEFNDALREIDILYDLAFLLMDLAFRRRRGAANRVLNGWLDEAARGFSESLWDGLAALPLFQSVRAAVRAHVNGREGGIETARRYLATARDFLRRRPPVLIAVGGLSGSGKSTLARALAPELGGPPGAVILRSDEFRKRMFGRDPTQRLAQEAYAPGVSAAVYAAMIATAERCLRAGAAVVLDATFLERADRERAQAAGSRAGVEFQGVWLDAPPVVLRKRLDLRTGDASDADRAVLEQQLRLETGEISWRRVASGKSEMWVRDAVADLVAAAT